MVSVESPRAFCRKIAKAALSAFVLFPAYLGNFLVSRRHLLSDLLQGRGAKLPQGFDEILHLVNELRRLGRGDPARPETLLLDTAELEQLSQDAGTLFGTVITIQVIAFTLVSAAHKDAVDAPLESCEDMMRRNTAGAHYSDRPYVGRVLQTTNPSQVSSSVRSPGAEEAQDLGLKTVVAHRHCSLFSYIVRHVPPGAPFQGNRRSTYYPFNRRHVPAPSSIRGAHQALPATHLF